MYVSTDEYGSVFTHNDPSIFYSNFWKGHSYTLARSSVPANPISGQRILRPGTVAVLNPTDRMLYAATDATNLASYQTWLISSMHDLTHGNAIVEVVAEGEIVSRYCFGVYANGSYLPANYGKLPSAIKTQNPSIQIR